jgi:methylglutaconyl-CoA hydratase
VDVEQLLVDIAPSGVATLTFNRPDCHNAFDDAMIRETARALADIGGNRDVRVLILAGQGKSFSAGADLNYMRRAAGYSRDENVEDAMRLGRMLLTLRTMPIPTIAVVQGAAYGGGVGLVAACDIVVASSSTTFALTEVKLGLVPAMISPFVIDAIGARQAGRYFQTAERFDAVEASRIGLVHEVVVDEVALGGRRDALVRCILEGGPEAVRHAKKLAADAGGFGIDETLLLDLAGRIADRRAAPEGLEGMSAFLERRRPSWAPD